MSSLAFPFTILCINRAGQRLDHSTFGKVEQQCSTSNWAGLGPGSHFYRLKKVTKKKKKVTPILFTCKKRSGPSKDTPGPTCHQTPVPEETKRCSATTQRGHALKHYLREKKWLQTVLWCLSVSASILISFPKDAF